MSDILIYVAIGFVAQIIDGAIGMAYGLVASSVLMSVGVTPAAASACVHAAEVFTTAASGAAHWRHGNVRWDIVWRIAVPGMIGAAVGAVVLTSLPADRIRPFVSAYLLAMGLLVILKALRPPSVEAEPRASHLVPLGLVGGFLDAVGGGGWGPMVTSTLVGRGTSARFAIGSTNLAEFFVTFVATATFVLTIGLELWPIMLGLIVGGVMAAPLAAYATRHIPNRPLMVLVGLVVIALSARQLLKYL